MTTEERAEHIANLKRKVERWQAVPYEERARRMRVWRHNGLLGACAFFRPHLLSMFDAATTSDETREIARRIEGDLEKLRESLKTRRPGT